MDNLSTEAKVTSLTMIQGIVNRFSDKTSKLKGIYITVMSALLTVAITYILPKQTAETPYIYLILMSLVFLIICLCFLSLDRTFLYYGRIMRKIYDCKANDRRANGKKIKNYYKITPEFHYIKKRKLVSNRLSMTQVLFYIVPLFIFEVAIWVIGVK